MSVLFLSDDVIWSLLNSGQIGFSIVVVLLENYLQNLEKHATELALSFDIAHDFATYRNRNNGLSNIAMGVFTRALHICSEKYLAQEIKYLIDVFAGNGHSFTVLKKVTKEYKNNITSEKEKENIDTIKNDKIVNCHGYRNMKQS